MATLIPTIEKILTMKVKPEEGELHLLKFLNTELDASFEVYFNPYMNGDRPDIIIMRKGHGVMVIEVKDYNLDLYELDDRKNFVIKSNKAKTYKSPIFQVLKYKKNLYELHIDKLLEKKIKDSRNFSIVSSAVYFHKANSEKIEEMLVAPFKENLKYQKTLEYIDLIGRDNLNEFDFNKILKNRYLKSNRTSFLFTDDIYESFKRFLKPPIHLKEQRKEIRYSPKQMEIIYDSTRKEQRIKGVVGSGKTTILAARAVQAHKRTNGDVLILTFNITLRNYIKDKISDVREEFPWENFVISNYHLFINSQLNNLSIPVEVNELSDIEKDAFLENKYYSNKKLFLERKEDIKTYDVILIDEIQDYKRAWMEIIKECFLSENGEYILFGDVKQNIYNNTTDGKDVSTNVRGVTELKICFRSAFKIKDLAIHYQKDIFRDKYEIDNFNVKQNNLELDLRGNQQGNIIYIPLTNTDNVSTLYTIIHENAINKNIHPNDITILGHSISLLKRFDAYYRYSSNEKTNTMFETFEVVYRMGLNYIKKNNQPIWLKEGIALIKRQNDYKTFDRLSVLFTIYDLYKEYGDKFKDKLDYYTLKFKTTTKDYLAFREKFETEINDFIKDYGPKRQTSDLEMIRKNKKIHFYMNSGTVKISTVHSFKGWESETLFLIIEKNFNEIQTIFDELLYTGITRSRENLIIINFGNEEYGNKLKTLIDKVK